MKRLISIFLVFSILCSLLPATVFAAEVVDSGKCGENLTWTVDDANVLTISGSGKMDDYGFGEPFSPEVSYSNQPWKAHKSKITKIVIQPGVTSIGAYAFSYMEAATEVSIPDTVTSIGMAAFSMSRKITSVTIPDSVISIGEGAFNRCYAIKNVVLSKNLTRLAPYTFNSCLSLMGIIIPAGIQEIGDSALSETSSMEAIHVEAGNQCYKSVDGILFDITGKTLIAYSAGKGSTYSIPEGVEVIGKSAFKKSGITEITIPGSVTTIEEDAFYRCGLKTLVIPEGVRTIGDYAFDSCSELTSITFPNSLISIGRDAFYGCFRLKKVTLPAGLSRIAGSAFRNCSALTRIDVDSNNPYLKSENGVLYNKAGTTLLICPPAKFSDSNSSFTVPNGVTAIGDYAFAYCKQLKTVRLPAGITSIGDYAFYNAGVWEINFPDSIRTIGKAAFCDCSFIRSRNIEIPNGVTRIEDYTFDGCLFLESIVIPNTVEYIGKFAFRQTDLKTVTIPRKVSTIERYTFWYCDKMTSITLPAGITAIGRSAFENCNVLTDVYYSGTEKMWDSISVDEENDPLTNAAIHCAEYPPEEEQPGEEDGYRLSVYATDRSLSVSRGDYLKLLCTLRSGGETVTDWASPACVVGTKGVIQVSGWEKAESGGYWLTVTGLKTGTSSVTVTDSVSGANVTLDITVNDTDAIPYTDLITNVPHFYPQVFGDRDTLTNFYNISGMYMRDFPYANEIKPENGIYNLSFTIYSTSSMYGSVDVYDKDGNWRSSTRINKFPPTPTGILEIGADTFLLVADALQGATLSYTANSFSAETKVSIEVPVGGYFTISNNALESPSCMLYNSLDLMLETLSLGADITFTAKDLIDIQDEILKQAMLKPTFMAAFLSQTNDFIKDSYQSATLKNTAEFISEFSNLSVEILADQGIDVWAILKAALNISADVAVKVLTPKFISATLGLLLTGNKAANMLCQAVEIKYCEDNDYVVLHTADSGRTICGVQVKDENSVLPEGALMQVFRVGEYEDFAYELEGKPVQAEDFTLYNICFMKGGKEVNPSGQVEVMIPKPEGYRDCVILHQQEDGSWTPVNYWAVDGILHFYVNHFSLFAVVNGSNTPNSVSRVYGATRYDTAFKAADELKETLGVDKFQNIIVACGTNFPDALSGTYLAARKNAPILLVKGNNVAQLNQYIRNNLAERGTLYLLGDNGVVPDSVGKDIAGITVKRLGGATRYDTNLIILKEAGVENKDILVCTGLNFADSLSASASGLPILLVKGGLTDAQKAFLASTSGKKIIVGGTSAVSATVEKQLAAYGSVKRLAGATRYDTSVLVAKEFFSAPKAAVLAYAQNFPDGLSGGPLAYTLKAPLILTDSNKPSAAVTYATGLGIKSGYVLGGPGLISDKVVKNIFSMAASDVIVVK